MASQTNLCRLSELAVAALPAGRFLSQSFVYANKKKTQNHSHLTEKANKQSLLSMLSPCFVYNSASSGLISAWRWQRFSSMEANDGESRWRRGRAGARMLRYRVIIEKKMYRKTYQTNSLSPGGTRTLKNTDLLLLSFVRCPGSFDPIQHLTSVMTQDSHWKSEIWKCQRLML